MESLQTEPKRIPFSETSADSVGNINYLFNQWCACADIRCDWFQFRNWLFGWRAGTRTSIVHVQCMWIMRRWNEKIESRTLCFIRGVLSVIGDTSTSTHRIDLFISEIVSQQIDDILCAKCDGERKHSDVNVMFNWHFLRLAIQSPILSRLTPAAMYVGCRRMCEPRVVWL